MDAISRFDEHGAMPSRKIIHFAAYRSPVCRRSVALINAQSASIAAPWRLHPGQTLSLRLARPLCLRVQSGRLWVTTGDGQTDHFLAAGDRLQVREGCVVIEGLPGSGPAVFSCEAEPQPLGLAGELRVFAGEAGVALALLARATGRLLLAARFVFESRAAGVPESGRRPSWRG